MKHNDIEGIIPTHKEERLSLLSGIADMYFNQNMTQSEIAKKMYLSRSNVSRLLKMARDVGILEIKVHFISKRCYQMEEALKERFGLKDVFVYNTSGQSQDVILDMLARQAAEYVDSQLSPNMCIGVTRGTTFALVTQWLSRGNPRPLDLRLVQLSGAEATPTPVKDAGDLIRKMLSMYGGRAYYLNAPLFVESEDVRKILENESSIQETMRQAASCDIIITGIGYIDRNMDIEASIWNQYLTKSDIDEIVEMGGVGHIFFHILDENGNLVDHPVNRRVISTNIDAVRHANVVAVCCGKERAAAVRGTLRFSVVKTLFIDRSCAKAVLSEN